MHHVNELEMSSSSFMCFGHGLNEDAVAQLLNPTLEDWVLPCMISETFKPNFVVGER